MKQVGSDMLLYFEASGIIWYIYNKKTIERPKAKEDEESLFNALLKKYLTYLTGETYSNDW